MSRDFRTVKSALEKKDRTAIETQSVSDKLESFIDLMLIAAVKGRMWVRFFGLEINFGLFLEASLYYKKKCFFNFF